MINNNFTFIVPAAGKSKRFYNKKSKIFYRYKKKLLIEHVIDKCSKISKEILIVSNKKNFDDLKLFLKKKKFNNIKIVIQKDAIGMGHAVHLALKKVKTKFSAVIWADQIYLKKQTILKTINFFFKNNSLLTFPIFKRKNPYVSILRDDKENFLDLIQSRETLKKNKYGETDCGFFVFKTNEVKKKLSDLIIQKEQEKLIFYHHLSF
jgi:bifunctional N-acetylglucosamine-1-phosphate-uridyltransferase/glucosamine-1-phosphate-acetyltransferase GlmU-like protein